MKFTTDLGMLAAMQMHSLDFPFMMTVIRDGMKAVTALRTSVDDLIIHLCTANISEKSDQKPSSKRAEHLPQQVPAHAPGAVMQQFDGMSKEEIIQHLDREQFASRGPGCYHLRTPSQLWADYLASRSAREAV